VFLRKTLAPIVVGLFVCAATAAVTERAAAQDADDATAYGAWLASSQANDIPKAIEAAEAYLAKFPAGAYADFIKKWLSQTRLSALDTAIKAKDMTGMIAAGRLILANDPENLNVLYALAFNLRVREIFASPQNFGHAVEAREFAQKAVALVEGGKTLTGVENFDKNATLAWLYQTLAAVEANGGGTTAAIELYEKSSALGPDDVAIKGRNLLSVIALHQNAYSEAAKAFNALPEADRTAAEPSDALKAARDVLNGAADAFIDTAAAFIAFGREKKLPAATVDRVNQTLETVYKGRHPEDATLEGLKKILTDKGVPAGA